MKDLSNIKLKEVIHNLREEVKYLEMVECVSLQTIEIIRESNEHLKKRVLFVDGREKDFINSRSETS